MSNQRKFANLGEQLNAIRVAEVTNRNVIDQRLLSAATGVNESLASAGGFLAGEEFTAGLWEAKNSKAEIMARVGRQLITRAELKIPAIQETSRQDGSRYGGLRMKWTTEAAAIESSRPRFSMLHFVLKKLAGLIYVTDELVQDFPALEQTFRRMFISEAHTVIENEIINGLGTGTPLGILRAGCTIEIATPGQAAGTITAENILAMWERLPAACRDEAVWLTSLEAEKQFAQLNSVIKDGEEPVGVQEITYFPRGTFGNKYATLMGCPIVPVEYCPPPGARGDIILADLSQYLLAERAPNIISSIHINYLEGETAFRATFRVDGHPAWATPRTRRVSGITESPFVVLGAR